MVVLREEGLQVVPAVFPVQIWAQGTTVLL